MKKLLLLGLTLTLFLFACDSEDTKDSDISENGTEDVSYSEVQNLLAKLSTDFSTVEAYYFKVDNYVKEYEYEYSQDTSGNIYMKDDYEGEFISYNYVDGVYNSSFDYDEETIIEWIELTKDVNQEFINEVVRFWDDSTMETYNGYSLEYSDGVYTATVSVDDGTTAGETAKLVIADDLSYFVVSDPSGVVEYKNEFQKVE